MTIARRFDLLFMSSLVVIALAAVLIDRAVEQMNNVAQTNTALAEESAASCGEMESLVRVMDEKVDDLTLLVG